MPLHTFYVRYVSLDRRGFAKTFETEFETPEKKNLLKQLVNFFEIPRVFHLKVWDSKKDFENSKPAKLEYRYKHGRS